jgi:hypothetical protein
MHLALEQPAVELGAVVEDAAAERGAEAPW